MRTFKKSWKTYLEGMHFTLVIVHQIIFEKQLTIHQNLNERAKIWHRVQFARAEQHLSHV